MSSDGFEEVFRQMSTGKMVWQEQADYLVASTRFGEKTSSTERAAQCC